MASTRELADDLIRSEGRATTPFGLYVVPSAHPAAELARGVERTVFGEFFDESADVLADEYGAYEASSVFLVIMDHIQQVPAGVERMILPSPAGFKSLNDIERVWGEPGEEVLRRSGITYDLDNCWDIATIAVMPDYRRSSANGIISLALVQGVISLTGANHIDLGLAVFDLVAFDLVQAVCGRCWTPMQGLEPRRYLGSPSSIATYCDVPEFRERLAFTDASLYEMLFLGAGLEAAVSTPGWDLDVAERVRLAS